MSSAGEASYCVLGIENDVRLDGRGCLDTRPMELELSVIAQAAGSARLRMGGTDVIVGVKVSCLVAHSASVLRRRLLGAAATVDSDGHQC
jgi:exosome complex RNA-binding protein Rrp42 (RNase PH superfamily)